MTIDRAVMIFAGSVSFLGIVLATLFCSSWLILPLIVSVMLIQAPLTGFCPAAWAFKKMGLKPGPAFYS